LHVVQPIRHAIRPTSMRTVVRPAALTLAAALLLAGCGSDTTADSPTAVDPTTTSTTPETPTTPPTVGSYPSYEPQDYAYTLHVTCFCAGTESGIRITVEDGKVTDAVYADDSRGIRAGAEAPGYRRLTIDDVIDAANNTLAAQVDVTWPAGQDYPRNVYVDLSKNIADEEIGYAISDVTVG
jgi:major membrane immunogen (membrane-anchored lipoprotein)